MINERERILETIRKLMALAESTHSEAEATAAALQAQKLIARHDVAQSELTPEQFGEVVEIKTDFERWERWRSWLARVVADNFRCKHYFSLLSAKHKARIVFVGHELDAKAACVSYSALCRVCSYQAGREEREQREYYGTAAGVRATYATGFVAGVRDELERNSVALMLVRQPEVDDYYDALELGQLRKAPRQRMPRQARSLYDQAHQAGREAVRSSRLDGQKGLESHDHDDR